MPTTVASTDRDGNGACRCSLRGARANPFASRSSPGTRNRVFFANASYVKGRVREAVRGAPTAARWLVFDAEAMVQVDSAGLRAIEEVARELEREGITLVVARMRAVTRQRFDESGLADAIGLDRLHPTVQSAVEACLREQSRQPPLRPPEHRGGTPHL